MSLPKKLLKAVQNLFKQILQLYKALTKQLMNWLLRSVMILGHRSSVARSGFVLPTVTLVILVVALLTTAIVFRSFDRARNATFSRVDQRVLAAAGPGLNRAKAKIEGLLADPTLPRSTPSDLSLYQALQSDQYTFQDETRLQLNYDVNNSGSIQPDGATPGYDESDERINTGWMFPVDTDNNGLFDSYSLYALYFRTPLVTTRGRVPLEARTRPMDDSAGSPACAAAVGTSASLVGSSSWYKAGANLKKSFFVLTATVPITQNTPRPAGIPANRVENYTGVQGFSALELQQDQARIPLSNNAVVYEDDLEITPGSALKLNGRVQTNSNFFTGRNNIIEFLLVSSPKSCFYQEENSKITVGGNALIGSLDNNVNGRVRMDRFASNTPQQDRFEVDQKSVAVDPNNASTAAYDSRAFVARINTLVSKWRTANQTPFDSDTTGGVTDDVAAAADPPSVRQQLRPVNGNPNTTRQRALEQYFQERTRRVPFAENANPVTDQAKTYVGTGEELRPPDEWIYPANPANNNNSNNGLNLVLNQPPATEPDTQESAGREKRLGDRLIVGNGLPAKWWNPQENTFGDKLNQLQQQIKPDTPWDEFNEPSKRLRYRTTQVETLSDLGNTERNGYWEQAAYQAPVQPLDGVGGLRVVTGAGIYVDGQPGSFPRPPVANPADPISLTFNLALNLLGQPDPLGPPWDRNYVDPNRTDPNRIDPQDPKFRFRNLANIKVWPDTMPMSNPQFPTKRGDLLMRATAVYHYRQDSGADALPIACISSYYDPTSAITAQNEQALLSRWTNPDAATQLADGTPNIQGRSNNGIPYPFPGRTIGAFRTQLDLQARLVFPDGRIVNEPLRRAMTKYGTGGFSNFQASDYSAVDTAICSLSILNGAAPAPAAFPPGAIYETSFLDARQIKAIDQDDPTTQKRELTGNYDLSIEQRQPLEVRATVLDLRLLRITGVPSAPTPNAPSREFLLPASGIIYATRDDALLDLSQSPSLPEATRELQSPVDYLLDPTRRPNGILLRNGSVLARGGGNTNRYDFIAPPGAEKGLILATNLPAYVQADGQGFNLHQTPSGALLEEFTQQLATNPNWNAGNFYGRTTLEPNFACRQGDPRLNCPTGDLWRSATIVADSITLLSNSFRFGFRNEGDYDLRNNIGNLPVGYDLDGDGTIASTSPFPDPEAVFGIDLNGNGTKTDPAVPETSVTATAARLLNGFYDNNFVTSADSFTGIFDGKSGFPDALRDNTLVTQSTGIQGSSYLNNFVTPVQRRANFPEYLMEICEKVSVEQCGPNDWNVYRDGVTPEKASALIGNSITVAQLRGTATTKGAGTTASPPLNPVMQRYPRRVAFQRNPGNNQLSLFPPPPALNRFPAPLGIAGANVTNPGSAADLTTAVPVQAYRYDAAGLPRLHPNALWYRTTSNSSNPADPAAGNFGNTLPLSYRTSDTIPWPTTERINPGRPRSLIAQPILVPVLQLHSTSGDPTNRPDLVGSPVQGVLSFRSPWIQQPAAPNTIFNLVVAGGDSPTRPNESNGGLHNFVRFLENWSSGGTKVPATINGSFIQFKRSAYATAPFITTPDNLTLLGLFNYQQAYRTAVAPITGGGGNAGRIGYYVEPVRRWGFDVGALSQLPDLFSQRFTTPPSGAPNEFYREVNRDDEWVRTLLCAKRFVPANPQGGAAVLADEQRPTAFCTQKTGG